MQYGAILHIGIATHRDLLNVATQLIDRKTAPFKAAAFKDHYDIALRFGALYVLNGRKLPKGYGANLHDLGQRARGGGLIKSLVRNGTPMETAVAHFGDPGEDSGLASVE